MTPGTLCYVKGDIGDRLALDRAVEGDYAVGDIGLDRQRVDPQHLAQHALHDLLAELSRHRAAGTS